MFSLLDSVDSKLELPIGNQAYNSPEEVQARTFCAAGSDGAWNNADGLTVGQ